MQPLDLYGDTPTRVIYWYGIRLMLSSDLIKKDTYHISLWINESINMLYKFNHCVQYSQYLFSI